MDETENVSYALAKFPLACCWYASRRGCSAEVRRIVLSITGLMQLAIVSITIRSYPSLGVSRLNLTPPTGAPTIDPLH